MSVQFNSFPSNSIARGTFVDQRAVKYGSSVGNIPRRLLVYGMPTTNIQVEYDVPERIYNVSQALKYGVGSQLHAMLENVFLYNPNIEIWACAISPNETATPSTAKITFLGTAASTGTISIYISGVLITVPVRTGDTPQTIASNTENLIMSNLNLPCTALVDALNDTQINLTSKWSDVSANDLTLTHNYFESESELNPSGVAVTLETFTGATGVASLDASIENFANIWFTMICSPFSDNNTLDKLETLADTLIMATEVKPFQYLIAKNNARDDYRTFVSSKNAKHLIAMFVENTITPNYLIAASASTYLEAAHSECPNASYSSQLKGVLAGKPKRINFAEKDALVKLGGCTTESRDDGRVYLENTVTTYKKNDAGAEDNAWRYPQTMAAYQLASYQVYTRFRQNPFVRAVIVNDDAMTSNPLAIKPKQVKATMKELIRIWEDIALIRDVDKTLESVICEIDANNSSRINYFCFLFFATPLEQKAFSFNWTTDSVVREE